MKAKIEVIKQISNRHPALGVDKGWSWYIGGMRDTGEWYIDKMLNVPLKELMHFLDIIIYDENKPKMHTAEPTDEYSEYLFQKEQEYKLFFGE